MKHSTIPAMTPILAFAIWALTGSSLDAQGNQYPEDPRAFHRTGSSAALQHQYSQADRVVTGFGERADDFLSRKIAPKKSEVQSSGWSLFGQTLQGFPSRKTIATVVLAASISLLALFLLRMKPGQRRGGLPDDVVSMLGQIPFGPNQRLQLVRLGSKLLLITTSQNGSHTLGEITDPEEVLQIESICRNGKFDTIGQTLRNRVQAASAGSVRPRRSALNAGRTLLEA